MYENGELGEVFIVTQKAGSTMQAVMDGWATNFSIALQHGVPLKSLIDKFTQTRFEPAGMTANKELPFATSLFDYIVRWLERRFSSEEEIENEEDTKLNFSQLAQPTKDISGPPCIDCGGLTMRAGTCYVCTSCGSTSGGCS